MERAAMERALCHNEPTPPATSQTQEQLHYLLLMLARAFPEYAASNHVPVDEDAGSVLARTVKKPLSGRSPENREGRGNHENTRFPH